MQQWSGAGLGHTKVLVSILLMCDWPFLLPLQFFFPHLFFPEIPWSLCFPAFVPSCKNFHRFPYPLKTSHRKFYTVSSAPWVCFHVNLASPCLSATNLCDCPHSCPWRCSPGPPARDLRGVILETVSDHCMSVYLIFPFSVSVSYIEQLFNR